MKKLYLLFKLISYIRTIFKIARKNSSPYRKLGISWLQEKIIKHRTSYGHKTIKILGKKVNYTRDEEIVHCLKEIFFEKVYMFPCTDPNPFIIDCGSHIGMSILFFKTQYPNAIIKGFEPDKLNYDILRNNITEWNFKNIEIYNQPVWNSEEEIIFEATGAMGGKIGAHAAPAHQTYTLKSVKLSNLLNKKIHFLKIDIEGAEYEIIKDCEQQLHFVENMFIEFHADFNEKHKLIEILTILERNKFDFYIKEANNIYPIPFNKCKINAAFDIQLNIFAFRNP